MGTSCVGQPSSAHHSAHAPLRTTHAPPHTITPTATYTHHLQHHVQQHLTPHHTPRTATHSPLYVNVYCIRCTCVLLMLRIDLLTQIHKTKHYHINRLPTVHPTYTNATFRRTAYALHLHFAITLRTRITRNSTFIKR